MAHIVSHTFKERFNAIPKVFKAPGRINLIGEHTDYNKGYVLPAAIQKHMYIAIAPNSVNKVRFIAQDLQQKHESPIHKISKSPNLWANYLLGVLDQFQQLGFSPNGIDCVFGGNIPAGAGLSSSAALTTGFAYAMNNVFQYGIDTKQLVHVAQKAEQNFAGVMCGIMDQFACLFGKKDHVIKLDCQTITCQHFPLSLGDYRILLCDSQVKHSLANSKYNSRRQECLTGLKKLQSTFPSIYSWRDVTPDHLDEIKDDVSENIYHRCHYVIDEFRRVDLVCLALEMGDLSRVGQLLNETHNGLRDYYSVSCPEIDFLQNAALLFPGVLGSRLMGGGFGGCTIQLVHRDAIDDLRTMLSREHRKRFKLEPRFFETTIEDGVCAYS